jgi:hypothetical protein
MSVKRCLLYLWLAAAFFGALLCLNDITQNHNRRDNVLLMLGNCCGIAFCLTALEKKN